MRARACGTARRPPRRLVMRVAPESGGLLGRGARVGVGARAGLGAGARTRSFRGPGRGGVRGVMLYVAEVYFMLGTRMELCGLC